MLARKYRSMLQRPNGYYRNDHCVDVQEMCIIGNSTGQTYTVVDLWRVVFMVANSPLDAYTAAIRAIATRACVDGTETLNQALLAIKSAKYRALSIEGNSHVHYTDSAIEIAHRAIRILRNTSFEAALAHVESMVNAFANRLDVALNTYIDNYPGADLEYGGDYHSSQVLSTPCSIPNIVMCLCSTIPSLQTAALQAQIQMEDHLLTSENYVDIGKMYNVYTTPSEWTLGRIAHLVTTADTPYCADAFQRVHPRLLKLTTSYDLRTDRIVRQTYEHFVTVVASVPAYQGKVKMPELTIGEYFRLDPRDQAVYRDWLADRHTQPRFTPDYETEVSNRTSTVVKSVPSVTKFIPGPDPRDLAVQRDRAISDAQLTMVKSEIANMWNIVSNTEQALDLDKKLGASNLRRSDKRALEQRTRDLVALHFNSMRELNRLNGYLRAY